MSSNAANDQAPAPAADLEPVRFSRLKLMGKSAAHYAAGFGSETGAMRKGTALHSYLIGDPGKVVLFPGKVRNGKVWEAFQEEHAGKALLIKSELAPVEGMRRALEAHPRAMELLGGKGIRETRIEWTLSGRACAGTPDVVHLKANGGKVLVELKTCVTSQPERFKWQARKMAYNAQCAWYADGLERTMSYAPGPVEEVYIVAVESAEPYPVTVIQVGPCQLAKGCRTNRAWFEQLLGCERTGRFPAYVESDVLWDEDEDSDGLEWGDAA
jgi:hypothetical protein